MMKRREPDIFRRTDWTLIGLAGVVLLINVPYLAGFVRPFKDTFYAFNVFYFFYNDFFLNGDLPMWEPFGRYGAQAYFPMITALSPAGIFTGLVGWALRIRDVLFLFSFSLFLEQLVFLYGTYLLSRGLFRHKSTVVFVCLSAALSNVLAYQIWFNFRAYALLPLVLHFGLRFFSTYRLRDLGFAMAICCVSVLGIMPYFAGVFALELSVIAAVLLAANMRNLGEVLKSPRSDALQGAALLAFSALALMAYYYLSTESLRLVENLGIARDPVTHMMDLGTFLVYGGFVGFAKFVGLVVPVGDFVGDSITLYVGLIPLVFLLYGLARRNILAAFALTVALVSGTVVFWALADLGATGTATAPAPSRAFALLLPYLAMALVALIYRKTRDARVTAFAAVVAVLALFSVGQKTAVARVLYEYFPMMEYFRHIGYVVGGFKLFLPLLAGFGLESFLNRASGEGDNSDSLSRAAYGIYLLVVLGGVIYVLVAGRIVPEEMARMAALCAVLTTLFVVAMLLARKRMSLKAYFGAVLIAGVCFQMLGFQGVVAYKYHLVSKEKKLMYDRESVSVRKYGFQEMRTAVPPASRPVLTEGILMRPPRRLFSYNYAIAYNLLQWDPCVPDLKLDYVNSYVADFVRLKGGVAKNLMFTPREGIDLGCSEPKLRLMRDVAFAGSAEEAGELISAPGTADKLVLNEVPEDVRRMWEETEPSAGGGTVEVVRFSANELLVEADVSGPKGAWLYYADAWHPEWKGLINGRPAHVARANHAFKAVMLPGGKSEVRFFFHGGLARYCVYFFSVVGLVFMAVVIAGMVRAVFYRDKVNYSSER